MDIAGKVNDKKTRTVGELDNHEHLTCYIASMIHQCEQYAEESKEELDRTIDYYNGKMNDLVAEEGRSKSVSRDVRSVIRKLMPSIMRTLLSNERIVDYHPVRPEDEESAQQATEYINHIIVRKSGAKKAIYDAIFDALSVKTGILKWVAYKRRKLRIYEYFDQPSSALLGLESAGSIVILNKREADHINQDGARYDFKLQRVEENIDIRLEAVPRGSFLIYPGSKSIEESPIVGERQIVTRSELVSRGYEKKDVNTIVAYDANCDDLNARESSSTNNGDTDDASVLATMEEVLIYEVYVKIDRDEDGIAELYKVCLAEVEHNETGQYIILEMESVEEVPYAEVVSEREAHRFEGHSVAEDIIDIQRVKTALLRETLDNIYWQNKKQPAVDLSRLTESGIEAVYNPAFGKPITLRPGANVNEAVQWMDVPFMADKSFAMMSYLDGEARNRTGITDSAGSVNPELFQDMTKFAAGLISESGIAQAAMIVDTLSGNGAAGGGGVAKAFRGLLKLVIAHADRTHMVLMHGKWMEYNPASWNADMDCVVNVGLGAGSKERDLGVLQMILNLQRELIGTIGPDNPFVKPAQLYNVLEKITETAGFSSAAPYFTKPNEEDMAALLKRNNGSLEDERKLHLQMQLERMKAQSKINLEREQMNADISVRHAELEKSIQIQMMKTEQIAQIALLKNELELMKHREKMNLEREKAGLTPSIATVADEATVLEHGRNVGSATLNPNYTLEETSGTEAK